ncbi:MAG: hypothetical protein MJA29_01700, partial [Candidatus Omnitrophica bacterium]|nr:hypothetical protein [Candidatus Omnitrophota bacterium]
EPVNITFAAIEEITEQTSTLLQEDSLAPYTVPNFLIRESVLQMDSTADAQAYEEALLLLLPLHLKVVVERSEIISII